MRSQKKTAANCRSIGVALGSCVVPQAGKPTFELPNDEIEIGMGIHGEPGVSRGKMKPANTLVAELMDFILPELELNAGDKLMAVAKQTKDETDVDWSRMSELVQTTLQAMMARGGAALGDKTVLDSLDAIRTACTGLDDPEGLLTAARGASESALAEFKDKPCKIGRARIFGDQTIGMDDPGMVAMNEMLNAIKDEAASEGPNGMDGPAYPASMCQTGLCK